MPFYPAPQPTSHRRPSGALAAIALAACLLAGGPGAALAASDYLLQIDGIKGESRDPPAGRNDCPGCWTTTSSFRIGLPSIDGRSGFLPMWLTVQASADYAASVLEAMREGRPMHARLRLVSAGNTVADDVIVDGRIITAENSFSPMESFTLGFTEIRAITLNHSERQRDGSFVDTAIGGWGLQGNPAFQGNPGVFDALAALGAVKQGDGSWLLTSAVPEPSTYALFGAGLALIGLATRRRSPQPSN